MKVWNSKGLKERKGVSVSIWVFVILGIVMAAFIFAGALQNIQMIVVQLKNQQAVEEFNSVYSHAESVCAMTKGAKEKDEISVSKNVFAFYASDSEGPAPDQAPHFVEAKNTAMGSYLCYQFKVEHDYGKFNCMKLSCNINMTYIGAPVEGSRLETIGKDAGDMYTYDVTFENMGKKNVDVRAKMVLK